MSSMHLEKSGYILQIILLEKVYKAAIWSL